MSFFEAHDLVDIDDVPDELLDVLPQIACETSWCRARRRKRISGGKYGQDRMEYPECGDRNGDYSGLYHRNRVTQARQKLADGEAGDADDGA